MAKKLILGTIAVFVIWSILDFLMHGMLLQKSYEGTAHLWRPMGEMKMGVMYVVTLIASFSFVYAYAKFVTKNGMNSGLMFGLILGLGYGVSFGYGSYCVMPIPYNMALTWFLGTLVEYAAAGAVIGILIKD